MRVRPRVPAGALGPHGWRPQDPQGPWVPKGAPDPHGWGPGLGFSYKMQLVFHSSDGNSPVCVKRTKTCKACACAGSLSLSWLDQEMKRAIKQVVEVKNEGCLSKMQGFDELLHFS